MPESNISCIKILAYNLRFTRAERGMTQDQVAQSAGLSHRAYQQLESGDGNPSLESLGRLSRFFKMNVSSLLRLNRVRIPIPNHEEFLSALKARLDVAKLTCHFRNDITPFWVSAEGEKYLCRDGTAGTTVVFDNLRPGVQMLVRAQMECEARGFVQPYQSMIRYDDGREVVVRCYPTLVYPFRGGSPLFTIVYFCDAAIDDDCKYYEFTEILIEALKAGGWVEKVV